MFDVAFSELVVIAIVALIVIGPEKLPKVARTLGLLVGRLQRYVANVKSDIEREMQFEDLQKLQQEIKQGVEEIQTGAREVENSIGGALTQAKKPETPSDSSQ
jgi:sec-independent protein translocase protein TatB